MKSDVPPPVDRTLRAILSIIFSVLCFSVLNAISKTLSQTFPVVEVIWGRYIFAFIFMLVLFLPQSGMNLFRWHNVPSQIIRGLLLFFSSFLYFHGIVYLAAGDGGLDLELTSPLVGDGAFVEVPR